MSNKFCGSYNGVENYLSNIICWQTCQTLLSICRKHSVAHHKACRTFSVEHFDVENLPWSMGKCIVEHFLSKIVCFPGWEDNLLSLDIIEQDALSSSLWEGDTWFESDFNRPT